MQFYLNLHVVYCFTFTSRWRHTASCWNSLLKLPLRSSMTWMMSHSLALRSDRVIHFSWTHIVFVWGVFGRLINKICQSGSVFYYCYFLKLMLEEPLSCVVDAPITVWTLPSRPAPAVPSDPGSVYCWLHLWLVGQQLLVRVELGATQDLRPVSTTFSLGLF